MNFEVRGGKVYKEPACQNLGSNWERIESVLSEEDGNLGYPLCSNWERIERILRAVEDYCRGELRRIYRQQLGKN
jgi:hypothetical protein